jgi:hypothetical protein
MRTALSIILALALCASASAQTPLHDENILTPLPDGFKLAFQDRQGATAIGELIPVAETVEDWSVMVTTLTFGRVHPPTLDLFADSMSQRYAAACGTQETVRVSDSPVNGYPSGLWRIVCPMNPGTRKPEYMYMKLIQGDDALYAVQYAYRATPTVERNAAAEAYLATVIACDTRKPDHPCPSGLAPTTLPR